MNAKTARDAMREFLSLLSGSDRFATELLLEIDFEQPTESHILSIDELSSKIHRLCSLRPMAQLQLDRKWHISFLEALLVLAVAGKPYVPLMRRARAKCDYVLYTGHRTVLDANTQVYRDTFKKVVTIAERLLSENRPTRGASSHPSNLLKQYITTNRLLDWIRRAVIADLIQKGWEHTLGDLGRKNLTRFRGLHLGPTVSDQFARSVFTALDRRGVWSKLPHAGVSMNDIYGAAIAVCISLNSIKNGSWEGKFVHLAQKGAFGPHFGALEEYMHIEPEFRVLGEYAWKGQCLYKKGLSVRESIVSAKLEMLIATSKSLTAHHLLNDYVRTTGLLDWLQHAVIADLINEEQGHKLSNLGRINLTRFRDSRVGSSVSDHFAHSVFTALDRRDVWPELSHVGITMDDIDEAAVTVCTSLSAIENSCWEGDFIRFAQTGAFWPCVEALDEDM